MICVKHLAQCLACVSCYTKPGRLRCLDFLGLSGSLLFSTCKSRRLENVVLLSFSAVGTVSVLHEIYGIISLKIDFCLPTDIKGMVWIILKVSYLKY